jgi:hypothetical protein
LLTANAESMEGYNNPRSRPSYRPKYIRSEAASDRRFERWIAKIQAKRAKLGAVRKALTKAEMVKFLTPTEALQRAPYLDERLVAQSKDSWIKPTKKMKEKYKSPHPLHLVEWRHWDDQQSQDHVWARIQAEHGSGKPLSVKEKEQQRVSRLTPLEKLQEKMQADADRRKLAAEKAAKQKIAKAKKAFKKSNGPALRRSKKKLQHRERCGKRNKKAIPYTHLNGVTVDLKIKYFPPRGGKKKEEPSTPKEGVYTPYIRRGLILHANGENYFHSLGGTTVPLRHHTKYWYFLRKRGTWCSSVHHPYEDEEYTAALAVRNPTGR